MDDVSPGMGPHFPHPYCPDFFRHSDTRVFCRADRANPFPYTDGNDLEERLLHLMRIASDKSIGSQELVGAIRDFPSRYHLSPRRANLFRPLAHLLTHRVLIAGAGCGVEPRFAGELGADVWAVEGSFRRAEIAAERCSNLPNVSVFCSPIQDFRPSVRFDAVTLTGVLEYSPRLLGTPDAPLHLLRACHDFLTANGVLVVAIENFLGLKYFAGAPEDHVGISFANQNGGCARDGIVTFGRLELERLLRYAGFSRVDFLYPFPDYKFPRILIHASACEAIEDELCDLIRAAAVDRSGTSYEPIFSEEMCWPAIIRNGLLPELSNSFLAIASKADRPAISMEKLVYCYADDRRAQHAKETVIERCASGIWSRRRALFPDMRTGPGPFTMTLRDEPFVRGRLLTGTLIEIVSRTGWRISDIAEWAAPWVQYLRAHQLTCSSRDRTAEILLPAEFVDCTPSNIVIDESGSLRAFDQEWAGERAVALQFVLFRGLFQTLLQIRDISEPEHGTPHLFCAICREIMLQCGIETTEDHILKLVRDECAFQEFVTGRPCEPERYLNANLMFTAGEDDSQTLGAQAHIERGLRRYAATRNLERRLREYQSWAEAASADVAQRDLVIRELQCQVEEQSRWAQTASTDVAHRDTVIRDLQRRLENQAKDLSLTGRCRSVLRRCNPFRQ